MMNIRKAAVLGAGVMGAQIAAHLINADIPVILFDIPAKDGDPNGIVLKAIANFKKLKPNPLTIPSKTDYIIPANYDQHLELLKECDLVIEAVAERLDIKDSLYKKIAPYLGEHAIFVTNTSGLSIEHLAKNLPEKIQKNFCGVHFFNPPRYMHLIEIIPHSNTDHNLLTHLETFLVTRLGKGVVYAKDTPCFIGNRVGVFSMLATIYHAEQFKIPLEIVDALTGPALGRAKSATFRTADVVGLDTFGHVVETLATQLPKDPWHKYYQLPQWLKQLIFEGALGQKTGKGIYQKVGKDIHVLDLETNNYRLADKQADPEVLAILKNKDPAQRLEALHKHQHPQAQFLWACLRDLFHYSAVHLADIADTVRDVDLAIRWGFAWSQGPFELWQSAGFKNILQWIEADRTAGKCMSNAELPHWVNNQEVVYKDNKAFAPNNNQFKGRSELAVYQRQRFPEVVLGENVDAGKTIFETPAVRCWTDNDGIAILSFKTKLNTINEGVLDGIAEAIKQAEKDYKGLVIWQRYGDNFSAGANLAEVDLAHVEPIVKKFQQTALAIRYANIPVVVGVQGLALGGGCELSMHSARVVAACESYIGLPEVGVGLLPAGGGCKEFALRAFQEARGDDPFRDLQQYFKQIAMAEVSSSAEEARQKNYMRNSDIIVMNAKEVLFVAKQQALALAASGYHPPLPPRISVVGKPGIATFMMLLVNMREGKFISDHDYLIGCKIAEVICGGQIEAGTIVDEEWFLRLERTAFVELAQTEKSQARIKQMLTTGKPLRN